MIFVHHIRKPQLDELEERFAQPYELPDGGLGWRRPDWLQLLYDTGPDAEPPLEEGP